MSSPKTFFQVKDWLPPNVLLPFGPADEDLFGNNPNKNRTPHTRFITSGWTNTSRK